MTGDQPMPEGLARVLAAHERTRAVARELVGLDVHDANELAARSGRQLREVKRDGKGFEITADFCTGRINIETENGVVVETWVG